MKSIIAVLFIAFLSACSTSFTEVKQIDDKAYLQLTGAIANGTLTIDGQAIDLASAETFKLDGNAVAKFELASGNHMIEVCSSMRYILRAHVTRGITIIALE